MKIFFYIILSFIFTSVQSQILRTNTFYTISSSGTPPMDCGGGSDNYGDAADDYANSDSYGNIIWYSSVTVTTCGDVASINIFLGVNVTTASKTAIYTDDGGVPGDLIGSSNATSESAEQYNQWTFTTDPYVESATTYWVAYLGNDVANTDLFNGGGGQTVYNEARSYVSGFPATATPVLVSNDYDAGAYITVNH